MGVALWIFIGCLGISACGGHIDVPDGKDPAYKDASFVYGYIDMTEAPGPLIGLQYLQVVPRTEKPFLGFGIVDGTAFFSAYATPGSYFLHDFRTAGGAFSNPTVNRLPRQAKEFQLKVDKPRNFYFVGSFRYRKVATGFFEGGKFGLEPSDKPTEKEVLAMLLPYMEKGTDLERRTLEHMKRIQ